jgi:hypothetical protein
MKNKSLKYALVSFLVSIIAAVSAYMYLSYFMIQKIEELPDGGEAYVMRSVTIENALLLWILVLIALISLVISVVKLVKGIRRGTGSGKV